MRHERVLDKHSYDRVNFPAAWPAGPQVVHLPFAEPEPMPADRVMPCRSAEAPARADDFAPTAAAPDVPAAVGGMLFAAYASLIGAFALATAGSAESIFVITISALFVVSFFTVPRLFFGVEPKSGRRPSLARFMSEGIQTLTGHSSGRDALVQMLIVPVLLTFGILAMGIAAALYL